jgi:citrate lyase beta subunit
VLFAVRIAAGEAGVDAYDGAFADVRDTKGFIAEAKLARRLGFTGKSCIHPSQVPLANDAFQPTVDEIACAQRIVEAAESAEANSAGAFLVDGRMVDRPFLLRARAVVAAARKRGLP